MQRAGVRDHHRIRLVFSQCFLQICLLWEGSQFLFRQGGLAGAQQDKVFLTKGDQVAHMTAANGAEAGDEEFTGFGHYCL